MSGGKRRNCAKCGNSIRANRIEKHEAACGTRPRPEPALVPPSMEPDWTKACDVCGQTPIVPDTGMCGPCTFGEAATAGGNW